MKPNIVLPDETSVGEGIERCARVAADATLSPMSRETATRLMHALAVLLGAVRLTQSLTADLEAYLVADREGFIGPKAPPDPPPPSMN